MNKFKYMHVMNVLVNTVYQYQSYYFIISSCLKHSYVNIYNYKNFNFH